MKYLFILLCFLTGVGAQAQTVYPDTVHIKLQAKHHAFITYWMPNKGDIDQFRYVKQVASQISFPVDSTQMITVAVPVTLVVNMYRSTGGQQERLVSRYNDEIKEALLAQLIGRRLDVVAALAGIQAENIAETKRTIQLGFEYLQSIKL